eukprot:1227728-Pleurochrysis_carterae.AAC.4
MDGAQTRTGNVQAMMFRLALAIALALFSKPTALRYTSRAVACGGLSGLHRCQLQLCASKDWVAACLQKGMHLVKRVDHLCSKQIASPGPSSS